MKKITALLLLSLFAFKLQSRAQTNPDSSVITIKADTAAKPFSLPIIKEIKSEGKSEEKISFTIGGEFRTRFEVRNGYRSLVPDDTTPAFFGNMRTRLNLDFKSKYVNAYISLQDARTYGEYSGQFKNGTIGLFEGYVDIPIKKGFSTKIGRQRIMLDNQRLFAQNDWRVWGRSHDAVRLKYKNDNTDVDVIGAFNQSGENNFGTTYTPNASLASEDYKLLTVAALKQKLPKGFSLFVLYAGDGFESTVADQKKKLKVRFTTGGRLEWQNEKVYITTAAYVQYGKNPNDQKVLSWYVQPEIKLTLVKWVSIRAGAEILSGQSAADTFKTNKFNSFVPLYGVAHRFNGYMDHFTRFPADTKNGGLINPYLYFDFKLSEKISLSENLHYFASHHNLFKKTEKLAKSIAFENDIVFNYNPNKIIGLEVGYAFIIPTGTLEYLKNTDTHKFNQWAYVQLSVKTDFFKFTK